MEKIIDVSKWQQKIDFGKVKKAGFTGVMIRAGFGNKNGYLYPDECFERFYADAVSAGMHVGAYFYTSGLFHQAGRGAKEAAYFLGLIKGKKFDLPIACDIELSPVGYRTATSKNAIDFCKYLENAGYYVMIYASDISGFKSRLDINMLNAYDKWVARYNKTGPQYVKDWGIWQYGGSMNFLAHVHVDGVYSTACDQNYMRRGYPDIIKRVGLNGYQKQASAAKLYSFTADNISAGDKEKFVALANELQIKSEVKEK